MVLPQEQFSFLKNEEFSTSEIGFLSHRKNIFYNDKYFITEKMHNDWTTQHLYGLAIERQSVLKNNEALKKLKESSCEYVPKVYDYSDEYVVFEFVGGRVLDRRSPHLPSYGPEWHNLYDGNKRMPHDTFLNNAGIDRKRKWDNQIKEAIEYMHNIDVCHTDLTLFNVMVEEKTDNIKIIDLLGCVNSTPTFKKLDWWCYNTFMRPHLMVY